MMESVLRSTGLDTQGFREMIAGLLASLTISIRLTARSTVKRRRRA
jgi:hypothetical protein